MGANKDLLEDAQQIPIYTTKLAGRCALVLCSSR